VSPPRVVHVSQPVEAGVARVVLDLLRDQQTAGWTVHLVSPPGWLPEQARELDIPWSAWSAGREPGPAVAREVAALKRLLRALDPDLVHLHSSKAGLAGRLALRGHRPTVFQPHAWSFVAAAGAQARLALAWERAATRWTALQLCCSAQEQRDGRRHGIGGRSLVVPNGVDLSRFAVATAEERDQARRRLGLPQGAPVAMCVGRLSRQKGQDVALAAWEQVRGQVTGAQLLLVGDGPERAALQAGAGEGVKLLGARDDVPELLAAADVALLPSRWEGLALSLLEAMARGRAVVTTAVAGSDVVAAPDNGPPAGAVVPIEDPAALARALVLRLSDRSRADREGTAGRQRVEQAHDVRATTRAVREAYDQLLPTR
jgi:glycosyltransferase involved in cell wall biosynthesis